MVVNQPLDTWEVARASAKPQASWGHLRDETGSEMRQSWAVTGFNPHHTAGDAPCAPSDEVFFPFLCYWRGTEPLPSSCARDTGSDHPDKAHPQR